MINGAYFVDSNPCGTITANQYQGDMKKSNINFFQKHHPNNHRMSGKVFTLQDLPFKEKKYDYGHVTMDMNNLQNWNATSMGHDYFEEHETNKHLHHPTTRHIYTGINNRDTHVVDEIEAKRKKDIKFHYPNHSFGLIPVRR